MTDETQISITIRPIYIERLIYWLVILILAVLLVVVWVREPDCAADAKVIADDNDEVAAPPTTTPTTPVTPTTEEPSCTDAKKNQDETDIDCGGSCTLKCASGNDCNVNADCVSNICTSGVCTTTPTTALSSKVELDLTNVAFTKQDSGAVKVTGISYKITNGLAEDLDNPIIKVFLKSKSNVQCLNQPGDVSGCDTEFASMVLTRLASGKSATENHQFSSDELISGSYVRAGDYWQLGEQFNVVVYLYDSSGDLIGGKTISDAYLVKP